MGMSCKNSALNKETRNHNEEKRYLMISANNITLRVGKKALFEDVTSNLQKETATALSEPTEQVNPPF